MTGARIAQLLRTTMRQLGLMVLIGLTGPAIMAGWAAERPYTYTSAPPGAVSIAEARAAPPGTAVTVSGKLESAPGVFASWIFDEGFLISDGTAGIYVSVPDDTGMRLDERVTVSGVVSDSYGLLVIAADAAAVTREPDNRQRLPTGSIGEYTEGSVVTVEGIVSREVTDDRPYGYALYLDDGSGEAKAFLPTSIDALSIRWLKPGEAVRITGMSGQYVNNHEIDVRTRADIKHVRLQIRRGRGLGDRAD